MYYMFARYHFYVNFSDLSVECKWKCKKKTEKEDLIQLTFASRVSHVLSSDLRLDFP